MKKIQEKGKKKTFRAVLFLPNPLYCSGFHEDIRQCLVGTEGAVEVADDFAEVLFPLLGDELVGDGHQDVLSAYCPKAGTGHVRAVELLA